MAFVYSTPFVSAAALVGPTSYLVPVGFIAVVRDLDAYFHGGLAGAQVILVGSAGQGIASLDFPGPSHGSGQWTGRQVFLPGSTFSVTTTAALDVTVSGYLLSTP